MSDVEALTAAVLNMAIRPEEVPVSEWQRALVRERLAAHERGEGETVSWTEVRREAQELLRKPGKRGGSGFGSRHELNSSRLSSCSFED